MRLIITLTSSKYSEIEKVIADYHRMWLVTTRCRRVSGVIRRCWWVATRCRWICATWRVIRSISWLYIDRIRLLDNHSLWLISLVFGFATEGATSTACEATGQRCTQIVVTVNGRKLELLIQLELIYFKS